jgi:hypothetical protein
MDESEYLKERLDDQINWYDRKSIKNQRTYKVLQLVLIVSAASIPFISGYVSDKLPVLNLLLGAIGVLITAITGILSLYKFQENWISYRTTCETLRHEKFLFLTKTDLYNGTDALNLLVQRVESLISKENSNWFEIMDKKNNKEQRNN